jgi:hypothetical protein
MLPRRSQAGHIPGFDVPAFGVCFSKLVQDGIVSSSVDLAGAGGKGDNLSLSFLEAASQDDPPSNVSRRARWALSSASLPASGR